MAEQRYRKPQVAGSIPIASSIILIIPPSIDINRSAFSIANFHQQLPAPAGF
jgi:TRAP-type C4-dicarboxylate transport system permease large subunit